MSESAGDFVGICNQKAEPETNDSIGEYTAAVYRFNRSNRSQRSARPRPGLQSFGEVSCKYRVFWIDLDNRNGLAEYRLDGIENS
jgi:hypothetical protein